LLLDAGCTLSLLAFSSSKFDKSHLTLPLTFSRIYSAEPQALIAADVSMRFEPPQLP
jgi:hypothetical protein